MEYFIIKKKAARAGIMLYFRQAAIHAVLKPGICALYGYRVQSANTQDRKIDLIFSLTTKFLPNVYIILRR